jgi:hypothetical protein
MHYPGCNFSSSSNGIVNNSAIAWMIDPAGVLRAYPGDNLGRELFSSTLPSYVKFTTPAVANSEVFIGTQNTLEIYGLL